MNKIIQFSFAEWLRNQEVKIEASIAQMRPELDRTGEVSVAIQEKDLVQLGTETMHKGERVPKYGVVTAVSSSRATVMPLSGGKSIIIPVSQLYLQDRSELPPMHTDQLNKMGANNLFIKMTERQAAQHARQQKRVAAEREAQNAKFSSMTPEIKTSDIRALRNRLFNEPTVDDAPKEVNPFDALFGQDPESLKQQQQQQSQRPLIGKGRLGTWRSQGGANANRIGNLNFGQ